MTDRPTCATCRCFNPGTAGRDLAVPPSAEVGECRRRPPADSLIFGAVVVPQHPLVPATHWCGEHEPDKAGEPAKPRTKANG